MNKIIRKSFVFSFVRPDEMDKLMMSDLCNLESNLTYDHDDESIEWDRMLRFMINVYSVIFNIY